MAANPINVLITSICTECIQRIPINPQNLIGLGVKNLEYYRNFIAKLMVASGIADGGLVALFQLLKAQKNRERLLQGMAIRTNLSAIPTVQAAMVFVNGSTVATTSAQTATKVATLKIPDSFPEICALLHILENITETDADIADAILASMWASSLNWGPAEQAINRAACERAWNSWGASAGKKTNSANHVIAFDPDIYANQSNDQVLLVDGTGATVGTTAAPITMALLLTYIGQVKGASAGVAIAAIVNE